MKKVTAIMATGHDPVRRGLARQTAERFDHQVYRNCELLILNQGADRLFPSHLPPRVRERWCGRGLTVGLLRNLAWEMTDAEYLTCWDDDDYHHPNRIQFQMDCISNRPLVLRREIVLNLETGASFVSRRSDGYENTLLWPRACRSRYSERTRGSDSQFIAGLRREYGVQGVDNPPSMYVRCWHGANLWDWNHFRGLPKGGEMTAEDAALVNQLVKEYESVSCSNPGRQ